MWSNDGDCRDAVLANAPEAAARLLRGAEGDRIVSELTVQDDRRASRRVSLAANSRAREVAEAYNAAVAGARTLNAFTVETPEDALAAADAADKARGTGELGALAGIPLGIKDLFATEGVDTTAGSRILKGFKPPYESTVTANLRKARARGCSASSTWTSSPWARRTRPAPTAR